MQPAWPSAALRALTSGGGGGFGGRLGLTGGLCTGGRAHASYAAAGAGRVDEDRRGPGAGSGEATVSLIALEAALEDGTAAGDGERQRVVAGYNEDDCRATLALRDWLEERRAELAGRLGEDLPRPVLAAKPGAAEDPETARIRSSLLADVSAETSHAIAPSGNARGAGASAAGRPARLAPARGQAGLVAVLLRPHAEPGGTDRRAGRAGRAHRRRRGRPGQEVGGAAVPLPAVSLRRSYLPMQGPPGTGKTYTAAEQILELIAHGRTVA